MKSKKKSGNAKNASQSDNLTDTDNVKLTLDKPEIHKIKKKKKKQKKNQKNIIKNVDSNYKSMRDKAILYLTEWKHNRKNWKFEKLKQIWLIKNMFNNEMLPEEHFQVFVEYIDGSKGKARENIVEEAKKVLEEPAQEDLEKKEKIQTSQTRAQQLLQSLSDI